MDGTAVFVGSKMLGDSVNGALLMTNVGTDVDGTLVNAVDGDMEGIVHGKLGAAVGIPASGVSLCPRDANATAKPTTAATNPSTNTQRRQMRSLLLFAFASFSSPAVSTPTPRSISFDLNVFDSGMPSNRPPTALFDLDERPIGSSKPTSEISSHLNDPEIFIGTGNSGSSASYSVSSSLTPAAASVESVAATFSLADKLLFNPAGLVSSPVTSS
jgi:hypothetical protein